MNMSGESTKEHRLPRPLQVALISHSYSEPRYRAKLELIGREVDLEVISPCSFDTPYGKRSIDEIPGTSYRLSRYETFFPIGIRSTTRWMLRTKDLGFCKRAPAVIHVENELSSFSMAQVVIARKLWCPSTPIVAFVWANLRMPGFRGVLTRSLAAALKRSVRFFIAGNVDARTLLLREGVPPDQIAVFPLVGIDINDYRPSTDAERQGVRASLGISNGTFVIGYAGRFVAEKGIPELVEAFLLIKRQYPNRRLTLLCIGRGPLQSWLEAFREQDVLVVAGGAADSVRALYAAMDTFVLGSRTTARWKEQFGQVLIEAMASGVPVVGSDSGAIPEVIGSAGIVVHEGDVRELVAALEQLLEDGGLRQALVERGRRRVAEYYSIEVLAARTVEIYRAVANESRMAKGAVAVAQAC